MQNLLSSGKLAKATRVLISIAAFMLIGMALNGCPGLEKLDTLLTE